MTVHTIDCHYADLDQVAAAYLVVEGDEAAFVEANTSLAVPRLLAALARNGLRPEQVRWIAVTHIHLDHAGGAGALLQACPNATLLAHPKAALHAIDPTRIVAGARQVYGDATFDALYGDVVPVPEDRVRVMQDGERLTWGRRTWTFLHTRGHANHHYCLHDDVADAVFTGDSFGILYPHLQQNGPFAFPSSTPTDFDPVAAHASVDRIVATGASRVFPTHFGEHGELPALAAQLHRLLDAHAAIVDEGDASVDESELDGFCRRRTALLFETQLEVHGLAGDPRAERLVAFDAELNAQGLAFAVRKRRYKRGARQ